MQVKAPYSKLVAAFVLSLFYTVDIAANRYKNFYNAVATSNLKFQIIRFSHSSKKCAYVYHIIGTISIIDKIGRNHDEITSKRRDYIQSHMSINDVRLWPDR